MYGVVRAVSGIFPRRCLLLFALLQTQRGILGTQWSLGAHISPRLLQGKVLTKRS